MDYDYRTFLEIEERIDLQKRKRTVDIVTNVGVVIATLLAIWIVVSTVQVWYHNDVFYAKGIDIGYPWWNFYEVLIWIGGVIGG